MYKMVRKPKEEAGGMVLGITVTPMPGDLRLRGDSGLFICLFAVVLVIGPSLRATIVPFKF